MPLAAPVLAVVDNAVTAVGVTATVTGADAGSVNTLSYQLIDAGFYRGTAWVAGGNVTGNGSIVQALTQGMYWFRCDSTLSGQTQVSNLVLGKATDGKQAIHEQCIQAIEAGLRSLVTSGLIPGITSVARVYDMAELNVKAMDLPGLAVCTSLPGQAPAETVEIATNLRDDIGYPVYVVLLDRFGGDYVSPRPNYLRAREVIFRFFRHQRLGPTLSHITRVETGPILKFEVSDYQLAGSVFLLRPILRDIRG